MIFFLARWHGFASIAEDGPHGARGDGLHGTVGAALAPTLGTVDFWDWFDTSRHLFKYIHRYIIYVRITQIEYVSVRVSAYVAFDGIWCIDYI